MLSSDGVVWCGVVWCGVQVEMYMDLLQSRIKLPLGISFLDQCITEAKTNHPG